MHILLVDDDIRSLAGLCRFLQLSGHHCDALESPQTALELYTTQNHALVISDLKMPGIDGIELLRRVRQHNPHAAVIIVTGYADEQTAAFARRQGAYAFLPKPVNLEEILSLIDALENQPLT